MRKLYLLKKLNFLFAFTLLMFGFTKLSAQLAQTNWKYSNPKPVGIVFQDMSFIDNNTGLAVGLNCGIARTKDAGATWQYGAFVFNGAGNVVQRPALNDVHFVTPSVAYAVGDNGLMIKSTDGGVNWIQLNNNPFYTLGKQINGLFFINKDTGYIGGEPLATTGNGAFPKLYRTKDGGNTWDSLPLPQYNTLTNVGLLNLVPVVTMPVHDSTKIIKRIYFVNDSVGYVTGAGTQTRNYINPLTNASTSTLNAAAAGLLWKFKSGVLFDYSVSKERLGNNGIIPPIIATSSYRQYTASTQTFNSVIAANDSVVLIGSNSNGILIRVQTGRNDSTVLTSMNNIKTSGVYQLINDGTGGTPGVQTFTNSQMNSMAKAPNGNLILTTGNGSIGTSTDKGLTWKLIKALPPTTNYNSLALTATAVSPDGRIWVAGNNGVIADSVIGTPWKSLYNTVSISSSSINAFEFADCNNGVAVGGFGLMYTTSDAGATWQDKTIPSFAASLISMYGMSYNSANNLLFSSSNGNVYSSLDQGTTNNLIFSSPLATTNYGLSSIGSGSSTRIWVAGYRNSQASEKLVVFRSLNNGISWDTAKAFPLGTLAPVCQIIKFISADTGYMAGSKGKLFKTVNGGNTWTDISPNAALTTASLNALGVYDKNTIYYFTLASSTRYLYKSTDGGVTWSANIYPVTVNNEASANINGFIFHDANNFMALTGPNKVLVTTDGGTTWVNDQAPSGGSFTSGQFVPKVVPAGTPMSNRKAFIGGSQILEYGSPLVNVASTETIVNANCTNLSAGSITVNAVGGIPPYTFSINAGTPQTSNVFTGLTQGAKSITIRDAGCGILTKTVTVGFTDNLTLTTVPSIDTTVCAGAPVPLVATATAGSAYAWVPVAGLSSTNTATTTAIVNSNASYTVSATLNGCVRTKIIPIIIKANPIISAGSDKTIVQGDAVILNGSGAAGTITWTPFGTLTNANTYTPTATPNVSTKYTLKVVDNNSCTSTDDVDITVIPYCLKPMAAFTPNNDGVNDKWLATIGGACTIKVSVAIYNRYGNAVYKNENYQNDWDGKYKNEQLPDGTYYYSIVYQLINGNTITLKGDLTILR